MSGDLKKIFFGFLKKNKLTQYFKVLIVEFGSTVMSCHKLSAANWGWCILLGAFELVWGQIVAFVPTKRLPKQMTVSICLDKM